MYFKDTETVGLSGIVVLIQWAKDDQDVHLHHVWKRPVHETLNLIEDFMHDNVCLFNVAFDSFHFHKLHSILRLCADKTKPPNPRECWKNQRKALRTGLCLKPPAVCDLLLLARRGKYQSLMRRDPIRIRRVPTVLSDALACELDKRIVLPKIYNAKQGHGPRWKVYDIKDEKHFKDVVLSFNPSSGLKFLAEHALGRKRAHFDDIALKGHIPEDDFLYAPLECKWLPVIEAHIEHWATDKEAQYYAAADIFDTRDLYNEVFDSPEPGDTDSNLAWHVGGVQWRGLATDNKLIKENLKHEQDILATCPCNINKPSAVRAYMTEVMDEIEALCLAVSTKKEIIKRIADDKESPASDRAKEILRAKAAKKRIELYEKLILAGRLHPVANVIGTKTSRMTSSGGLNYMGINKNKAVRRSFPMADRGFRLSAGDFWSYEMTIAQGVYKSAELKEYLLGEKKIHGDFGTVLFEMDYDELLETDGTDNDLYTLSKSGVFAKLFFGTAWTLSNNLGVTMERAEAADEYWREMLPSVAEETDRYKRMFCSIDTEKWQWNDPVDAIDNGLGFFRTFTLENMVCKALFDLGMKVPPSWLKVSAQVVRRKTKGLQKAGNAVRSALLGGALALQGSNMRSGGNHPIQGFGGEATKRVQMKVADLQPVGVHPWRVATLNMHDEILAVHRTKMAQLVQDTVQAGVEEFRAQIPLIYLEWNKNISSWAAKGESHKEKRLAFFKRVL